MICYFIKINCEVRLIYNLESLINVLNESEIDVTNGN